MDLKDLTAATAELIDVPLLFNEEGEPTDGFKVVGANSTEYQEADRQWRVKHVRKAAHRGRQIEAATTQGAQELVAQAARHEFEICKACIKEIYGFTINGAPAPLNEDTLKEIFTKRPTWRVKVVTAIEAENLFTSASSAPGAK